MQILYEPVAVMRLYVVFLPCAANKGKAIGKHREGEKQCAESKYFLSVRLFKTATAGYEVLNKYYFKENANYAKKDTY